MRTELRCPAPTPALAANSVGWTNSCSTTLGSECAAPCTEAAVGPGYIATCTVTNGAAVWAVSGNCTGTRCRFCGSIYLYIYTFNACNCKLLGWAVMLLGVQCCSYWGFRLKSILKFQSETSDWISRLAPHTGAPHVTVQVGLKILQQLQELGRSITDKHCMLSCSSCITRSSASPVVEGIQLLRAKITILHGTALLIRLSCML